MSGVQVAAYLMNPAEDVILFGPEITEGMWVLPESRTMREDMARAQDESLRQERFRRVIRLTVEDDSGYAGGKCMTFVGEWVDGYQEVHRYAITHAWLVKKDSRPAVTT